MTKNLAALRAELKARLTRPDWPTKRQECFVYHDYRCGVCGRDWLTVPGGHLQAHHTPDGYRNLGNENVRKKHLIPLCNKHHLKGRLTAYQIKIWRSSYRWQKRVGWLTKKLLRLLAWPFRLLWRAVRTCPTRAWKWPGERGKHAESVGQTPKPEGGDGFAAQAVTEVTSGP